MFIGTLVSASKDEEYFGWSFDNAGCSHQYRGFNREVFNMFAMFRVCAKTSSIVASREVARSPENDMRSKRPQNKKFSKETQFVFFA